MEEEDERREAAIASAPALQPNFKSSGVTKDQISKFQVKFLLFHGEIGLFFFDDEFVSSTLSSFTLSCCSLHITFF